MISNAHIITTEYRVYDHPLLPRRIVKRGFCWPALIIGPAYLLYRRLWVASTLWLVAMLIARYFIAQIFVNCDIGGQNCYYAPEDQSSMDGWVGFVMFSCLLIIGLDTNRLWEADLLNRGYTVTTILRARSMDDALAILEREKNPVTLPDSESAD